MRVCIYCILFEITETKENQLTFQCSFCREKYIYVYTSNISLFLHMLLECNFFYRWFNQTLTKQSSVLSFDPSNKLVKSTAGIRVVELRSPNTEMVLQSWVFTGRVLKFSFQIPQDIIEKKLGETNMLVVEDTTGCIVKAEISF